MGAKGILQGRQKGLFVENFIETKNLSFRYSNQGKNLILDNISLGIKQGEFVCILGRNGSGKSTLVKTFNSLLLPSAGKVYVNGMDTADEKHNFEIHKQVGLILQNPDKHLGIAMKRKANLSNLTAFLGLKIWGEPLQK